MHYTRTLTQTTAATKIKVTVSSDKTQAKPLPTVS